MQKNWHDEQTDSGELQFTYLTHLRCANWRKMIENPLRKCQSWNICALLEEIKKNSNCVIKLPKYCSGSLKILLKNYVKHCFDPQLRVENLKVMRTNITSTHELITKQRVIEIVNEHNFIFLHLQRSHALFTFLIWMFHF